MSTLIAYLEQHLRNFIKKQASIKQKQQVNKVLHSGANLTHLAEAENEEEEEDMSNLRIMHEEEGEVKGIHRTQTIDATLHANGASSNSS